MGIKVGVRTTGVAVVDQSSSVVLFRLCGQPFALPVDAVSEVVPIAWLARPPQLPSAVEGILNLGGLAVPVLRLDRLLGLSGARFGLDASILIMKGAAPLGLLAEHVDGVKPASAFSRVAVESGASLNGCLAAELEAPDGGVFHLLSWERLLMEEEKGRLADFQARSQSRLAELADASP